MVQIKKILDKDGKQYKTKDGKELTEITLTKGDKLICDTGLVITKTKNVTNKKGEQMEITEHLITGSIKTTGLEVLRSTKENPLFIKLTPTQANTIKNFFNSVEELNQQILVCYEYTNEYGTHIGIGFNKQFKEPKQF